MPESGSASPRIDFDEKVKAFFVKYSWETYPSKHLKYLEIPAYDLETGLAVDEVCHITDQKVSDDDCECLAKALMAMRPENMKQVYLTNNDIGDRGCVASRCSRRLSCVRSRSKGARRPTQASSSGPGEYWVVN